MYSFHSILFSFSSHFNSEFWYTFIKLMPQSSTLHSKVALTPSKGQTVTDALASTMEPTLFHLSILFSLHTLNWGSAYTQNYTSSFNTFRRKTSTSQKLKVFKKLSLCSLDKEVLFKTFLFYDCQDKSVLQTLG